MATAIKSQSLREPLDFTGANFITLLCAVIILVAFIFMPWMWTEMKYNGARLMSDVLTGGSLGTYVTRQIVLIPLAAGRALWGDSIVDKAKAIIVPAIVFAVVGFVLFKSAWPLPTGYLAVVPLLVLLVALASAAIALTRRPAVSSPSGG